jgi:ABC-type Fe3+-hydroxamate transport system substrate-binding protein
MRIISLVPSITETLIELGAGDSVAGATDYCIAPAEAVARIPKVGGTKTLDVEKIAALKATLVIANREENVKEQVEAVEAAGLDVWLTDIVTISDVLDFIVELPKRTPAPKTAARSLNERIKAAYEFCQTHRPPEGKAPRAACLIWRKPYMGCGRDTYIHHLIEAAGGANVHGLKSSEARYPETTLEELSALDPEVLLLPSEPFPFGESHVEEICSALPSLAAVRENRVHPPMRINLVCGEDICWFGWRTPKGLETLYRLFAPGARWGLSY